MHDPVLEGKGGVLRPSARPLSVSPEGEGRRGGFPEGGPCACYNAATSPPVRTLKFGHFLYHVNLDAEHDAQGIRDALAEARLAEDLGYDALWFSEHHFTGEVVYADPLVFAAAVAVQTKRVTLGLGVIEMAFHHPVQTAIQTALLDNLSEGRLIVGTARGSSYNAFEYMGFGTSIEEQTGRIDEAEELLALAWTGKDVRFHGKHFHAEFPAVRPRPAPAAASPALPGLRLSRFLDGDGPPGQARAPTDMERQRSRRADGPLPPGHAGRRLHRGAGRGQSRPRLDVARRVCRGDRQAGRRRVLPRMAPLSADAQ